jgi:CRP-like cAMP-binding protein
MNPAIKKGTGDAWQKTGGESPLTTFVKSVHPISEGAARYIDQHSYPKKIGKGSFLLKTGEICNHLYFIRKGVIRGYIKDGSKEVTTWITPENEMVTSIRGLNLQEPSLEYIQAIEDCDLVVADYADLNFLYQNYIEINIVGRKILEQYYKDAEERAFICRIPNAAKRYRHFLETKGAMANRIPLKYIASYLGMTIETMSRIRSKKGTLPG